MTVLEYLRTATEAEVATYITGLVQATIETFYKEDVPFERLLAVFGTMQDTLSSEMHDGEADFNKSNSILMAFAAANLRISHQGEENE